MAKFSINSIEDQYNSLNLSTKDILVFCNCILDNSSDNPLNIQYGTCPEGANDSYIHVDATLLSTKQTVWILLDPYAQSVKMHIQSNKGSGDSTVIIGEEDFQKLYQKAENILAQQKENIVQTIKEFNSKHVQEN